MTTLHPVTILIVEDEPAHSRLVELNLRRAGMKNDIVIIDNGREALNLLLSEGAWQGKPRPHPLLVLLDLNMPGLSGYQVLETIKETPALRRIPVIILTTTDDPREAEKCYGLGCNIYITKPVKYEDFARTVHELGLFLGIMAVPDSA